MQNHVPENSRFASGLHCTLTTDPNFESDSGDDTIRDLAARQPTTGARSQQRGAGFLMPTTTTSVSSTPGSIPPLFGDGHGKYRILLLGNSGKRVEQLYHVKY